MNLTDIHRLSHLNDKRIYILLSSTGKHMLRHKENLNKYKKKKIYVSYLSIMKWNLKSTVNKTLVSI